MFRFLLWPVTILANLVGVMLRITGRALGFCLGLLFAIVGGLLCCTIIGAIPGIPLGFLGVGMMLKCFW